MTPAALTGVEELVLLAVASLGDDAYGVTVQHCLRAETRTSVSLGSVYAILERLERAGLLRAGWGEALPRRGGRRKRLFTVTASGLAALRHMERMRHNLRLAVPRLRGA